MTNERTYQVFKHPDNDCRDSDPKWGKYRARLKSDDRNAPTCPRCDATFELDHEETISEDLGNPKEMVRDFIDDLDNHTRATMLGMCMESIRGSWSDMDRRLAIIGYICESGVGDQLSDEFLEETKDTAVMLHVRSQVTGMYPDGRAFRGGKDGRYGKLWTEIGKDLSTMEGLASFIPDDMTFDDRYFERKKEAIDG